MKVISLAEVAEGGTVVPSIDGHSTIYYEPSNRRWLSTFDLGGGLVLAGCHGVEVPGGVPWPVWRVGQWPTWRWWLATGTSRVNGLALPFALRHLQLDSAPPKDVSLERPYRLQRMTITRIRPGLPSYCGALTAEVVDAD